MTDPEARSQGAAQGLGDLLTDDFLKLHRGQVLKNKAQDGETAVGAGCFLVWFPSEVVALEGFEELYVNLARSSVRSLKRDLTDQIEYTAQCL